MAYEVYTQPSKGKRDIAPVITLRHGDKINLNRSAAQILKKADIDRVVVLWDSEKRKMAIKRAADDDPYGYKVSYREGAIQAGIGLKSFAAFVGLKPGQSVKVYATYTNKMLEATIPMKMKDNKPET
jgi:hypothetical protein